MKFTLQSKGPRTTKVKDPDPFVESVSPYTFEKFAARYFQHGYDSKYTSSEIIRPLLDLKSAVDAKVGSVIEILMKTSFFYCSKAAVATFQIIMKFMGDKEDIETLPTRSGKNDKEMQRLESQYDILVSELYPIIAHEHQTKLEEEEDPFEKVFYFID